MTIKSKAEQLKKNLESWSGFTIENLDENSPQSKWLDKVQELHVSLINEVSDIVSFFENKVKEIIPEEEEEE